MPVVQISLLSGRSEQQKDDLAAAIAQALIDIAGADPRSIQILYHEYEPANWVKCGPRGISHAKPSGAKSL